MPSFLGPEMIVEVDGENVGYNTSHKKIKRESIGLSRDVINTTSRPIVIAQREGLKYTVPVSNSAELGNKVLIRYTITVPPSHRSELYNTASRNAHLHSDLRILKESIDASSGEHTVLDSSYHYEYQIDEKELEDHGGDMYISNLDIFVSHRPLEDVEHPYSQPGKRAALISEDREAEEGPSFNMRIRIIDNESRYGDRFININGQVYKVPSMRSKDLLSGVYVSGTKSISGCVGRDEGDCRVYQMTDCMEQKNNTTGFILFRTYEEAFTLGDVYAAQERETRERKIELDALKEQMQRDRTVREEELSRLKHESDIEKLNLENQLKDQQRAMDRKQQAFDIEKRELEHRNQMLSMQRKDYYEERSHYRKDSSELTKWLPTIFTGMVTVLAIVAKK